MSNIIQKKKMSLYPFRVWEKGQWVGHAFLTYIKRGHRNVYINVQIFNPRNRMEQLELYIVEIPITALKYIHREVKLDGYIDIPGTNHRKWQPNFSKYDDFLKKWIKIDKKKWDDLR